MRAPRSDSSVASPAVPASNAVRLPQWVFPLVTVVSLLLGATSIVRSTRLVQTAADSDLTNFFLRSADYILRGDPFHMYAVRADLTYPNFNPPLSMFLLAPLLGLARALGFSANYGQQITFVTLPFIVLVPVMGYLGLRVMHALYPEAPETLRLLLYAFICLSPLTWQSYSIWYHVEQPLMLCFLLAAALALQRQRPLLAGTLAGLAFLTRTTALIPLIALGVLLLMTRDWRGLAKFGGVSAAVAAIGFAPFVLLDSADMKYTFLSWRGSALIGSDSIWTIFAYTGNNHLLSLLDAAAKRVDTYSVIAVVVVAAFLAVRNQRLTLESHDLWALLAIAMLATPMLSKQVWPYYYLEPMVFIVVWELSTLHDRVAGLWRWPVLSISFTLVAAMLSTYIGLKSVGRLDALTLGITQTLLMAGFTLAVWERIKARKPSAAAAVGRPGGAAEYSGMAGMQPMTPPRVAAANGGAQAPTAPRPQQPAPQAPAPHTPAPQPLIPPASPVDRRPQWQAPPPAQPAKPAPGAAPAPPVWQAPGAQPGPSLAPGVPKPAAPAGPLWPGEGSAPRPAAPLPPMPQDWRTPPSGQPNIRPNGVSGAQPGVQPGAQPGAQPQAPNPEPRPDGAIDPWRDWPRGS